MRHRLRILVVALMVAGVVIGLAIGPAQAASGDPLVEVQFWIDGEGGNGFLLVTGTLPPETSLPATLTLPVPEGASLVWAGEITGLGVQGDIERQVVLSEGDGGVIASMSLETTFTGQYEAIYLPTQVTDDTRSALVDWVHSAGASRVLYSVVLPAGAGDIEFDPVPVSGPATNRQGESLYVLPDEEAPQIGSSTELFVSYVPGSLLDDHSSDGTSTTLLILGVVAALLAIVVVVVFRSQNRNRPAADLTQSEE